MLSHATTQMNPEDIVLSEISQAQNNKYCMIPLCTYGGFRVPRVKVIERDSRTILPSVWGGKGETGVIVMGTEFQLMRMTRDSWRRVVVLAAQYYECTYCHRTIPLKWLESILPCCQ